MHPFPHPQITAHMFAPWEQLTTSVSTASSTVSPTLSSETERPRVRGKFFFVGNEKLYIRGVTYGPFAPEPDGSDYHTPDLVDNDFARMRECGINTVRTYTVPPPWLLDLALAHGLYVMIGLPWAQHVAFLEEKSQIKAIQQRIRSGVRACADHPAVLCYTIGNEIPPSIVRWYGREQIERFLRDLYDIAKAEDPARLVTYVNFPTTEYLRLPFLDFISFNVYLEHQEALERYINHLQHMAGERPLLLAEVGLDSRRNGPEEQARVLDWQIRTIFHAGAAGSVVFAWTDEWYRGGHEITDWDFGLTTRERRAKPALDVVGEAFGSVPAPQNEAWPPVSVIICSYNGAQTIGETLEHATRLNYPDYEVIVIDDGSTDQTAQIAREYPARIIQTDNRGLSSARNTGLEAASGEIVAYLDDDAYPDVDWLTYLASAFRRTDFVGVGGPNIPPPDENLLGQCIGQAPGGPRHVMTSAEEAEHIPGCNMAFRRDSLQAVGGFDEQFRIAGDDVDLCWRLRANGGRLGFHPAALVWHHPRSRIATFWRQQRNYGRAEAMLEEKWPARYNLLGHCQWNERIYADENPVSSLLHRWRVYYGQWGGALFQPLYAPGKSVLSSLPQLPEWYLVVAFLGVLSLFGLFLPGLAYMFPLFLAALAIPLFRAGTYAIEKTSAAPVREHRNRGLRAVTITALYCLQPVARLWGRLQQGVIPWRRFTTVPGMTVLPRRRQFAVWSEQWTSRNDRLETIEHTLQYRRLRVRRGGDFDRWDLEIYAGILGSTRLLMAVEEHGDGRQMIRIKCWPRLSPIGSVFLALAATAAAFLLLAAYHGAGLVLVGLTGLIGLGILMDCGRAAAACRTAANHLEGEYIS